MRHKAAASPAIMIIASLVILALLLIGLGVGLTTAIGSLFRKQAVVGLGDSSGPTVNPITRVVFTGDDVLKAAVGGFDTLAARESGTDATPNTEMKTLLTGISVAMDTVAIAGQSSSIQLTKGFTPYLTSGAANAVVFMFSKNNPDPAATKNDIDQLITQAQGKGMIIMPVLLPSVGGDANYTREINAHLKDKESVVTLIDASNLRPTNTSDPLTIPLNDLRNLIVNAIKANNARAVSGGTFASGDVIPVPIYDQRTKWGPPSANMYCGITSVKMALDYYLRLGYKGLRNTAGLDHESYRRNWVKISQYRTNAAWSHFLANGRRYEERLDANNWAKAKEILSYGHPIVSYGNWGSKGGCHIVVIIGVSDTAVTIANPQGGKVQTIKKSVASTYLVASTCSYAGHPYYLVDSTYKSNPLR